MPAIKSNHGVKEGQFSYEPKGRKLTVTVTLPESPEAWKPKNAAADREETVSYFFAKAFPMGVKGPDGNFLGLTMHVYSTAREKKSEGSSEAARLKAELEEARAQIAALKASKKGSK